MNDATMEAIRFGQSLVQKYEHEEDWPAAVASYRDLLGEGAPGACVVLHVLGYSVQKQIKEILRKAALDELLAGSSLQLRLTCIHEAEAFNTFMEMVTRCLAMTAATLPPAPPTSEPLFDSEDDDD